MRIPHRGIYLTLQDIVVVRHKAFCIGIIDRIVEFDDFPCCRTDEALVIVVIRQRSGSRIEGGIDLGLLCSEVPRVAAAAVRMGISNPLMSGGVGCAVAADKRIAAIEHRRSCHSRVLAPVVITIDCLQMVTPLEHIIHFRYIVYIERI